MFELWNNFPARLPGGKTTVRIYVYWESGTVLIPFNFVSYAVSAQFLWNKHCGYSACDFCLAALETAQDNLRRLTKDTNLTIPRPGRDWYGCYRLASGDLIP